MRSGQTLDSVTDDQNLIDAGIIDSLAMVQIIVHLERDHGVDLRMGNIDPTALASVAGILKVIDAARK